MRVHIRTMVLCSALVCLAWPTSAVSGFAMELLMAKLDYLQYNLLATLQKDYCSSCREEPTKVSGRYMIQLGTNKKPFEVFCEQSKFGGGWTVIQHRCNGMEDFYRNWTDYREGFGNIGGEFWLGLEHIHQMTAQKPHELMVEVKDFEGNYGYAHYDKFKIGSEVEQYALKMLGAYNGTAGDSMEVNQGEKFTTADRDNDSSSTENCAVDLLGAWWYYNCAGFVNLNGYYNDEENNVPIMMWYSLKEDWRVPLSYTRMMIRETN